MTITVITSIAMFVLLSVTKPSINNHHLHRITLLFYCLCTGFGS